MKAITIFLVCSVILVTSTAAQISESTDDWPGWKKASLVVVGASSLLITIAVVGIANADTESGESNSANGAQSMQSDRKGQGYVEELKDELLVFVQESAAMLAKGTRDEEVLAEFAAEFPVLTDYYGDLINNHPAVISAMNETFDGPTTIGRLNQLMLVHLFGSNNIAPENARN